MTEQIKTYGQELHKTPGAGDAIVLATIGGIALTSTLWSNKKPVVPPTEYISVTQDTEYAVNIEYYNQSTGTISSTTNHVSVFLANMDGWLNTQGVITNTQYDDGVAQFHALGY